jgi:hypothetical protein
VPGWCVGRNGTECARRQFRAWSATVSSHLCSLSQPGLGPDNTLIIKQGLTLLAVLGRKAATGPHFNYTRSLKDSGFVWDAATLDRFLTDPSKAVPGTTMPVPLPDAQFRADIIAYLATLKVPAGITLETAKFVVAATSPGIDPSDWQRATPGVVHHIKVSDLPKPGETPSVGNNPRVVAMPTNATLSVPPGFTVKQFASDDGALLVTEDAHGTVWRIAYTGH